MSFWEPSQRKIQARMHGETKSTAWSQNNNEARTQRWVNKMSDHWAQEEKNSSQQLPSVRLDCAGEILQTIWASARMLMKLRFPSDYVLPLLLMSLFIRLDLKNGRSSIMCSRCTALTYISVGHELYHLRLLFICWHWCFYHVTCSKLWYHHIYGIKHQQAQQNHTQLNPLQTMPSY